MTEGLFILTTIFVAYVVYAIIGEQRATAKSKAPAAKPEAQAAVAEQSKPQVAIAEEKPAATKTAAPKAAPSKAASSKPAPAKAAAPKVEAKPATTVKATPAKKPATVKKTAVTATKSTGLKDPKTGDVVTAYTNYRFTKRWIKDALVEEGLLDKVYAGNEVNAEVDAKIKEAIKKLEAMDKYKA